MQNDGINVSSLGFVLQKSPQKPELQTPDPAEY